MDKHFLNDFVVGVKREDPRPWFNPFGDCIIFQMHDEAVVADRIDELLTILRSSKTRRPIGYQLKGVKALVRKLGLDGLCVESCSDEVELKSVALSALFLRAYQSGPETLNRTHGYSVALETSGGRQRVSASEFEQVNYGL